MTAVMRIETIRCKVSSGGATKDGVELCRDDSAWRGTCVERSVTEPLLDPSSWVDAHGDYLYRFALARVRCPETAEELVQETLLAALSARHSFRARSTERSWLTAILKRKVVDWLRATVRHKARQTPLPDKLTEGLFTRSGKWRTPPDDWATDDPASEMSKAEFWATLTNCLDKLPTRIRQAFVLRHLEDHPTEEVCRVVGASATNVWVMLHRARLRLWLCLSVNWFGEDPKDSSESRT